MHMVCTKNLSLSLYKSVIVPPFRAMASTKFYLDTRRAISDDQPLPLRLAISHRHKSALLTMDIQLAKNQWDAIAQKVVNHPNKKYLNTFLPKRKVEIDTIILKMCEEGENKGVTAKDIRDYVLNVLDPKESENVDENTLEKWYLRFAEHKTGRTKEIYLTTYNRLKDYLKGRLTTINFEDINKEWLENFDDFLAKTAPSPNGRNIHFRNIRAVFNYAIDNEITTNYPFRRFKLKSVPTRKRNLKVDALRKIFNADNLSPALSKYQDIFKLTFMLIGINFKDLCALKEIEDGRVEYIRAKTHKPYSIKVEPEALALIERYRGSKQLLRFLDTNKDYRSIYKHLNDGLKAIKDVLNQDDDGIEIKELTTYWARHSWATIAASLDIPKDTIAHALGHGGNSVTDVYIEFDMRKVDEANRRVLDWVLYGK